QLLSDPFHQCTDIRERLAMAVSKAVAALSRATLLVKEARAEGTETVWNFRYLLPAPTRFVGQARAVGLIAFTRISVAGECEQLEVGLVAPGPGHVVSRQEGVADLGRPVLERVGVEVGQPLVPPEHDRRTRGGVLDTEHPNLPVGERRHLLDADELQAQRPRQVHRLAAIVAERLRPRVAPLLEEVRGVPLFAAADGRLEQLCTGLVPAEALRRRSHDEVCRFDAVKASHRGQLEGVIGRLSELAGVCACFHLDPDEWARGRVWRLADHDVDGLMEQSPVELRRLRLKSRTGRDMRGAKELSERGTESRKKVPLLADRSLTRRGSHLRRCHAHGCSEGFVPPRVLVLAHRQLGTVIAPSGVSATSLRLTTRLPNGTSAAPAILK